VIGDLGPYISLDDSDIWVPRTVPYLEARRVARSAIQEYGNRLVYVGKTEADLLGFSRDCLCDEVCELANRCRKCGAAEYECACAEPDLEDWDICRVPAWHFRQEEPA
jgi:hypothetical protein